MLGLGLPGPQPWLLGLREYRNVFLEKDSARQYWGVQEYELS
jgi:hypothetical protein